MPGSRAHGTAQAQPGPPHGRPARGLRSRPLPRAVLGALESCGCCNESLHTSWPKTTQIYSLRVLEVRGPRSEIKAAAGWLLILWSLRGELALAFPGTDACPLVHGHFLQRQSLISTSASSHHYLLPPLRTSCLLIDGLSSLTNAFNPLPSHPSPTPGPSHHLRMLHLVPSAKSFCRIRGHGRVLGIRMEHLWGTLFSLPRLAPSATHTVSFSWDFWNQTSSPRLGPETVWGPKMSCPSESLPSKHSSRPGLGDEPAGASSWPRRRGASACAPGRGWPRRVPGSREEQLIQQER